MGEHAVTDLSAPLAGTRKRVYLDVCALNRPLDDQTQMRVRLEADAVLLILSHVRSPGIDMVISPVHRAETAANPDSAAREHVQFLLDELGTEPAIDRQVARHRAEDLHRLGLGAADAAHVASAELAGCDFVTVDDRLLRQMQRIGVHIWFGTPMAYCEKEDLR
jgi:predicted nucleic acid-binding protein